jgi:integrase
MLLAGQCGLRRGEIARASREDVEQDLSGWSLRVLGKGGHTRMVPLTDELGREILRRDPGYLFPSSHGGHLTPHHLGKTIAAALAAGHTTHSLRHRCATVSYAATRDLRAVQELLGHAKPETTAIYTLVPDDAVRSAMLAAAA